MYKLYLVNHGLITEGQYKWANIPKDIFIARFELDITENKVLVLEGFEQYIYLKEEYRFFNRKGTVVDTINVLGKYKQKVYQFSWNVRKNHYVQTVNNWGKEFKPLIWNPKKMTWEIGQARATNKANWINGTCLVSNPQAKILTKKV